MTLTKQNQKIKLLILVVLLKKINYDTKITELENKIPDINNLATKTELTTVEVSAIQLKKQTIILK